jgi:hypothetical protein
MNSVRLIVVSFTLLIPTFSLGCGNSSPPTATVSGHVKLDGVDLEGGRIQFASAGGGLPVEGDIKGGKYEVAKVPTGEVKVSISWVRPTGKKRDSYGPGSEKVDITEESIPSIYNTNTELRLTVTTGSNSKDFDLKKAK